MKHTVYKIYMLHDHDSMTELGLSLMINKMKN